MVFIRLLLLSPPLILIFTRLANSLDSTQQLLNYVDILQDSNDTVVSLYFILSPLSIPPSLSLSLFRWKDQERKEVD